MLLFAIVPLGVVRAFIDVVTVVRIGIDVAAGDIFINVMPPLMMMVLMLLLLSLFAVAD